MSPMRTISLLDLGRLTKSEKEARSSLKTVRGMAKIACLNSYMARLAGPANLCNLIPGKHINKDGRKCFSGDKAALKKSGQPG